MRAGRERLKSPKRTVGIPFWSDMSYEDIRGGGGGEGSREQDDGVMPAATAAAGESVAVDLGDVGIIGDEAEHP